MTGVKLSSTNRARLAKSSGSFGARAAVFRNLEHHLMATYLRGVQSLTACVGACVRVRVRVNVCARVNARGRVRAHYLTRVRARAQAQAAGLS